MTTPASPPAASYFDAGREGLYEALRVRLDRGEVAVQRCPACSATFFPPVLRCGECGSPELGWMAVDSGVVVAASKHPGSGDTTLVLEVGGCRMAAVTTDAAPPYGATVELVVGGTAERPRVVAVPHEGVQP